MSWDTAIHIFWALVCGIIAYSIHQIGWHRGRQYGRDEQWVEDVLAAARRDAERRDAYGRFRSLGGKN